MKAKKNTCTVNATANEKNARFNIFDDGQLHVRISEDNTKTGLPSFNLLPGIELHSAAGDLLCNVPGTCGIEAGGVAGCQKDCYACRLCRSNRQSTLIPCYARNTIIMRTDPKKLKREIIEYLHKHFVAAFRFHDFGGLESVEQLKLYTDIAAAFPEVHFYIYTKAFGLLLDYLRRGWIIPENFNINLSAWNNNVNEFIEGAGLCDSEKQFFANCQQFIYDDGTTPHADKIPHCPAVDKNGKNTGVTCAACKRCVINNPGRLTCVYPH